MNLIFFAAGKLPYPTGNGSSVLTDALLNCFTQLDFRITVVPVHLKYNDTDEEKLHVSYLEKKGISVVYFDTISRPVRSSSKINTLRRTIYPKQDDHFPHKLENKPELLAFLADQNKEQTILCAYSWPAVVLISNVKGFFKIASIVDPLDKYLLLNKQLNARDAKKSMRQKMNALQSRKLAQYAYTGLKQVDAIIQHASHHAQELKEEGYQNVHYIPHPLPIQEAMKKNIEDTVVVLISGSLKGTASRHGFLFFLEKLLPAFRQKKQQISSKVIFRIVGHGQMKPTLKERLVAEPMVDFVGFAESIEEEYAKADIILVNIPVTLGFRTRIAEAFSYGLCVVAHAANAEGMPEIRDGVNAMSDHNPDKLADKLTSVINNVELRQELGRQAKITFDNEISTPVAVKKIAAILKAGNVLSTNE